MGRTITEEGRWGRFFTTASGSWTVPQGVYFAYATVQAPGAGGNHVVGADASNYGGGGGGAGETLLSLPMNLIPGGSLIFVIGNPGDGGTVGSPLGSNGGDVTLTFIRDNEEAGSGVYRIKVQGGRAATTAGYGGAGGGYSRPLIASLSASEEVTWNTDGTEGSVEGYRNSGGAGGGGCNGSGSPGDGGGTSLSHATATQGSNCGGGGASCFGIGMPTHDPNTGTGSGGAGGNDDYAATAGQGGFIEIIYSLPD